MDHKTASRGGTSPGDVFDEPLFDKVGVGGDNENVIETEGGGDIPWGFPRSNNVRRFDYGRETGAERAARLGEEGRGHHQRRERHWQKAPTERVDRVSTHVHMGETCCWSPTLPSARQAALLMRSAIR